MIVHVALALRTADARLQCRQKGTERAERKSLQGRARAHTQRRRAEKEGNECRKGAMQPSGQAVQACSNDSGRCWVGVMAWRPGNSGW